MSLEIAIGLISAALGAITQLGKDHMHDMHKLTMALAKQNEESRENAAKRGGAWGRRFAMAVVLLVSFGGLVYAAEKGIGVSQIIQKEPFLNLFNVIRLGGGPQVVSAEGFVLPDYVQQSVISIIFFLFGSSSAKR